jgi:hypothetical protein
MNTCLSRAQTSFAIPVGFLEVLSIRINEIKSNFLTNQFLKIKIWLTQIYLQFKNALITRFDAMILIECMIAKGISYQRRIGFDSFMDWKIKKQQKFDAMNFFSSLNWMHSYCLSTHIKIKTCSYFCKSYLNILIKNLLKTFRAFA